MANHRRRREKNQRSGCLFCKPHKVNGASKPPPQAQREIQREREQIESDLYQADWVLYGDVDLDDEAWEDHVLFRPRPLRVGLLEAASLRGVG